MKLNNPFYDWVTDRMTFNATMISGDRLDASSLTSAVLFIDSSDATTQENEYPYGKTCPSLSTATWDEISLYDLTYGCIPTGWSEFFNRTEIKSAMGTISDSLKNQIKDNNDINPAIGKTFRALYMVSPAEAKSLILGQDPAPEPGLATGLSFSLNSNIDTNRVPSVQRVLLEAQNEGFHVDIYDGDLTAWGQTGVMLLNSALTIPCPEESSSCTIGGNIQLWEDFTKYLIDYIDETCGAMTFILWGSAAGQYAQYVWNSEHLVLKGGHPSPMAVSADFFCRNYFNCTDQWLNKSGRENVDWNLTSSSGTYPICVWGWDSESKTSYCKESCTLATCTD